jgi:hypothetical protein
MHLVIDNMANLSEIDRIDDFIIPILLVAIEILSLTTVTWSPSAGSR